MRTSLKRGRIAALVLIIAAASLAGLATPATGQTLLSSDEFTGAAGSAPNPQAWTELTGGSGWGNNELETYTDRASNVSLDGDGHLKITAQKETYTGSDGITRDYTSGRIISTQPILYGYTEARIWLPSGQGFWPAFWTVGADQNVGVPWPLTGEIDIMEAINTMKTSSGTIHGPDVVNQTAYQVTKAVAPSSGTLAGAWHTYAIDWTATYITFYLDGQAYETITRASMPAQDVWEFDTPQLIQLNLAVGGNSPGSPNASTPFPSSMLVDYVRHYSN